MCAGGFELISQVSSTLWPDINRRNYQSTDSGSNGPSVAQEPSSDHSRQAKPNWVKTRRPRTACWTKLGAVGPPDRPTDLLVGRPGPWPHSLSFDTWRLPAGFLSRFQVLQPVAPSYKYKGRGRGMDTHITPSQLTFLPWSLRPSS